MKKNILYVFCSTNYSGAEIVMERLILHNEVINAVCLCPPGDFADRLEQKGLTVIKTKSLISLNRQKVNYNNLELAFILFKKVASITALLIKIKLKYNISIVHANNLAAAVYVLPSIYLKAIFFKSCNFIWSNHDLTYPDGAKSDKLAFKCVSVFDKTIAVSSAVRNKFIEVAEKVVVLYNGLDLDIYRSSDVYRKEFRDENKLGPDEIAIGIIGLISERKGHTLLIEAFKNLSTKYKHIKLFIVGKFNPTEVKYEKTVLNMISGEKNIFHLHFTENIVQVYNGLDIIINCSLQLLSEPLGTTIYEAMACEKLVIGSDTGGTPEIITDQLDGLLFQADSLEDLKLKLITLIENKPFGNTLKNRARDKVVSKFSIAGMIKNYNVIINNI